MKDSLGRHYGDAKRINSVLKVFGSVLLHATSMGVFRVQPEGTTDTGDTRTCNRGEIYCPTGEQPNDDMTDCAVANVTGVAASQGGEQRHADGSITYLGAIPGNGVLIGQFRLPDGRTALLIHNQNWAWTLWPTFSFRVNASTVLEVDPSSGQEAVVENDTPGPTLQLSFSAGGARLLIIPR